MDPTDEPAAPHAGIPDEELSPWQLFDRAAWQRVQMMSVRAKVRSYAVRLLAEHGVDETNRRLPPDVAVDSRGVVRFEDRVADTHIEAATGVVTIDPDIDPWW